MRLFSTDIDGTVFDGPVTAKLFRDFWTHLRSLPDPPLLSYNTGRSLQDVRELLGKTDLPDPDFIIAGVGTEMFDARASSEVSAWKEELSGGWDFETVSDLILENISPIEPQPDECQNEFKCSFYYYDQGREEIDRISSLLASADLKAQVVYSSNRDLDILPSGANKGNALRWLANKEEIPLSAVAVAGDSGNDSSMFLLEKVFGVVVANSENALVQAVDGRGAFLATQPCAHGVVEGLCHHLGLEFDSIPAAPNTSG